MRSTYALALLPIAAVLIGPFFLNRVTPYVLGMPLLLAWLALTLVLTSVVMGCIYFADERHAARGAGSNGDQR